MKRRATDTTRNVAWYSVLAVLVLTVIAADIARAEQPPPPCHPNPDAEADRAEVAHREDIAHLPQPLKERLIRWQTARTRFSRCRRSAEADKPGQVVPVLPVGHHRLRGERLHDPDPRRQRPGGVDRHGRQLRAADDRHRAGLARAQARSPTDPRDPEAFIDVFTDISGLFVINNESGWYEGWMIHDLTVAPVDSDPRQDGHAKFGRILPADAEVLAAMGTGHNVEGNIFTTDGRAVHFPSNSDHFPDVQTNVVPIQESMGAYNSMQQTDVHSYWEFNYTGDENWIHPLYELPFTGGLDDDFAQGKIGKLQSIVPGSGPRASRTIRRRLATTPTSHATPTSSKGTSTSSANSESAGSPAASPTKSISTSTKGWLRSSLALTTSSNGCLMPTPPRSPAWTPMAMASSPRSKATSTPRRMAFQTIDACSFPRRCSTDSP